MLIYQCNLSWRIIYNYWHSSYIWTCLSVNSYRIEVDPPLTSLYLLKKGNKKMTLPNQFALANFLVPPTHQLLRPSALPDWQVLQSSGSFVLQEKWQFFFYLHTSIWYLRYNITILHHTVWKSSKEIYYLQSDDFSNVVS